MIGRKNQVTFSGLVRQSQHFLSPPLLGLLKGSGRKIQFLSCLPKYLCIHFQGPPKHMTTEGLKPPEICSVVGLEGGSLKSRCWEGQLPPKAPGQKSHLLCPVSGGSLACDVAPALSAASHGLLPACLCVSFPVPEGHS